MSDSSEFKILYQLAKVLSGIVKQNPEYIPILFAGGVIISMIYNLRTTIHEVIISIFQSGTRFVTKLKLALFGTQIFDAEFEFDIFR